MLRTTYPIISNGRFNLLGVGADKEKRQGQMGAKLLVVFDLDGVLVDTRELHFETLNEALQTLSPAHVISESAHLSTFDGLGTSQKLYILSKSAGLEPNLIREISKLKQEITVERLKRLSPSENVLNTLLELKKVDSLLAVATNSVRETLLMVIERLGLTDLIDFSISREDVRNPKPHPEIYWKTMIECGALPSQTIVVEDSPVGQAAASTSGATVVPVNSPSEVNLELAQRIINLSTGNSVGKRVGRIPRLQVLIPMAGKGSRFERAGYTFPKPLIEVHGAPMIEAVVKNLNVDAKFTFVVQGEHASRWNLPMLLGVLSPDCNVVQLDGITGGAAETALAARNFLSDEDPLLIANSDQLIDWDIANDLYRIARTGASGAIWTFQSTHPKWSFAKVENDGLTVPEVAEKKPISDRATTGVYFWRRAGDFKKYADKMISAGDRTNGEYYICPVFNWAISDGLKIVNLNVKEMFGIGTPEDLKYFLSLGAPKYRKLTQ